MAGGGDAHLWFCDSVSRGGRKGGGESGGGEEVGGSGDVMRTGRGGGRGEAGQDGGMALGSGRWERDEKDDGGQGREVVEHTDGGREVRGEGVEGEGGSWGGCRLEEGETSAYGGNDTHPSQS